MREEEGGREEGGREREGEGGRERNEKELYIDERALGEKLELNLLENTFTYIYYSLFTLSWPHYSC